MTRTEQDRATITEVLTGFGLLSGVDFRAKVYMGPDGVAAQGVIVTVYGLAAPQLVAERADEIEAAASARGTRFHVSVRYPFQVRPHVPMVDVADFGTRVREVRPHPRRRPQHSF